MAEWIDYTGAARGFACVIALLASVACAAPVEYRVDPDATVAEYTVTYLGVLRQRGRFARTNGTVVVDFAAHAGRVDFEVDAQSVDSGWSVRDAFIRDDAMLDTERHRSITFVSTHLAFADDRLVRIDGRLSMRGVTRAVSLAVERFDCGTGAGEAPAECSADASATLHRSEFGMTAYAPVIGELVTLDFAVVARR